MKFWIKWWILSPSEYWGKKNKFSPETTLEKDIGISGDDSSEFLEKFLDRFLIRYDSQTLDPGKYFHNEGFGLVDFRKLTGVLLWIKDAFPGSV